MISPLLLRITTATLGCLFASACATPVDIVAVSADPQPWIGADIHVLFHYLGWPDSVESSNGRVGLGYTAMHWDDACDKSARGPDLVTVKFWIAGRQVVEVSGDAATALVLWGRSNRRLQVPYVVDVREWDRRLGLAPATSTE